MFRSFMLVLVVGASCVFAEESDSYPTTYDYLNIPEMLANDRLRGQYYDCFMGTEPCIEAAAKFFKGFFPEVIATQCRKCNNRQKEMLEQITVWYTENEPEKWKALLAKGIDEAKQLKASKDE